ncbi:HD domain-containing protein [Psychrobacter cryohalolentis]|uniref:HD domain-containing protein n=1 Tax=Psychrobacter cryohalolentis TaxID=330922 RepID=UPI003F86E0E7
MDGLSQIETELGKVFEWHLIAINNAIKPAKVNTLWQDIAVRYDETQRAYHSLQHIQQLFSQFEQIKHQLHEPHIIALALYYHDVIYDPRRSDNELKSAEYAVEALKGYLSAEQCQHIYALIMMTATHELHECLDKDTVSDAAYLLDMDLSILGTPWSEYQVYAQAVRQEYRHIANEDYRTGRIAVLKKLLAHPVLYLIAYYHNYFEVQARDNIKREISLLHAS